MNEDFFEERHDFSCRCAACFAEHMGRWIDDLGTRTVDRKWQVFVTITFRTDDYPWQRGFPIAQPKPHPHFAHRTFERLVEWLQRELISRVDYVVADQLGSQNGRLHQHAVMSADGLMDYPWIKRSDSRPSIHEWLWKRAGFNRILPFEHGAAFYIGRYIGRDAHRCEWEARVGNQALIERRPERGGASPPVGIRRVAEPPTVDELEKDRFERNESAWAQTIGSSPWRTSFRGRRKR